MRRSGKRPAIISLYNDFTQLFGPDYFDEADEEDNETNDNEQPDTTDIPDLEGEKSDEQENQEGQGLKRSTSNQMLSRLQISLTELEAGSNSEK